MARLAKLFEIDKAVATFVHDGATVAIGGHTLRRHPMALVYTLIRQRKSKLHVIGWNSGIDFDMLVGTGCVATAETSCVSLAQFGMGKRFRAAVESGLVRVIDHSETTAIDMFRGAAFGIPFTPTKSPLGTDLPRNNPRMRSVTCPFSGESYVAVQAVRPDVALIHGHYADRWGNVLLNREPWLDTSMDAFIARSAEVVIASVEQIVSDDYVLDHPAQTILPRRYVTAVIEAPFGAHPCACDGWYDYDPVFLEEYSRSCTTAVEFDQFMRTHVVEPSRAEYLAGLGAERVFALAAGPGWGATTKARWSDGR